MPEIVEPSLAANANADPKKAPTQGEKLIPKVSPKISEAKNPILSFSILKEILLFKNPIVIIPTKFKPNKIITKPAIILTRRMFCITNWPRLPEKAPSNTKIIVKPKIKPNELPINLNFPNLLLLSFADSPAKYEKYIGSIGNMQGEIKVINPSKNTIKYFIICFHLNFLN